MLEEVINMYDFEVVIDAGHGGDDPGAVCGHCDLDLRFQVYLFKTLPGEEASGNIRRP